MNEQISRLIEQIKQLENELTAELQQQQYHLFYELKGKRVRFEKSIKQTHKKLKMGVLPWLFGVHPLNLITAPIIYAMIIPLVISDICVSLYQATCFPIYKINKVKRGNYIVFDHHHLSYLNFFERIHCLYCSYANGLNSYIREILSRTEQYFCPIKHAHTILGSHSRYQNFIDYGDAKDYHQRLESLRQQLAKEE